MSLPFFLVRANRPAHAIFAGLLLLSTGAPAAEFLVTNTNDTGAGSLRDAIESAETAPGDDIIRFAPGLSGSTIGVSTGPFEIEQAGKLLITGAGLPQFVTLSAFGPSRLFRVSAGADLTLQNLVLADGMAPAGANGVDGEAPTAGGDGEGGGAVLNEGSLRLVACVIQDCSAGAGGRGGHKTGAGAGSAGTGGAGGNGGGVLSRGPGSVLRVENSFFRQNDAGTGGLGGNVLNGHGGDAGQGGRGGAGGGIWVDGGQFVLIASTVELNDAGNGGSGGANLNGGVGGLGGRGGDGGGLGLDGAAIEITNSTIRSNRAGSGGLGGNDFLLATDTGGASGDGGDGGGVWVRSFDAATTAHVAGSLILENSAGSGLAGGSVPDPGPGNGSRGGSGGHGGGLFVVGDAATVWKMRNCTVHRNNAGDGFVGGSGAGGGQGGAGGNAGNGGGIAFSREAGDYSAELVHLTITGNNAGLSGREGEPSGAGDGTDSSGGGIWEVPGGINSGTGVVLANSVVALNSADSQDNLGDFVAQGNNFTVGDPRIGILSNHGGPTRTLAPLLGSPLVNGGGALVAPLVIDQRGRPRPQHGAPDLGAFEVRFRPDTRLGLMGNPATHRFNNLYNPAGGVQIIALKLRSTYKRSFFVSIENDGDIPDDLTFTGALGNRTVLANVFRFAPAKTNLTGRLTTGFRSAGVAPRGVVNFLVEVRARSARVRANQTLFYRCRGSRGELVDLVKIRVY